METLTPIISWTGSTALTICLIYFFLKLRSAATPEKQSLTPVFRVLFVLPVILWVLLVGYQAKWQLFGFFDEGFLRVQRGFDTRGDLLGNRYFRGDILDADHQVLAHDSTDGDILIRGYPGGRASVHLLGYHDPVFGSTGLEKSLDGALMGREIHTPADFFRLTGNMFVHRKLHGNPVVLTVYKSLQETAAGALAGKKGAVVVIDPADGSIRALVSAPGFDPNQLDLATFELLRKDSDSPFLNRATHGLYPPGSTFKPLVAMLAVEQGLDQELLCGPGGYSCGPSEPVLRDYQYYSARTRGENFRGHGRLNLNRALAISCNVYFAQLGVKLGSPELFRGMHRAGLDRPVVPAGNGLVSIAGKLPGSNDLPESRTARLAIGQDDLLVTPLHLALIAAGLGNDGLMMRPRFTAGVEPESLGRLTDSRTATEVARMMIGVVETGTGKAARVPGIIVGGKTGTAEHGSGKSHGLFIGFAPWPQPRLAIAVVVENGGSGGRVAAPIAGRIIQAADELGLLKPPQEKSHGPE